MRAALALALLLAAAAHAETPNERLAGAARAAATGAYPRSWRGEPLYWTVVGAPEAEHEALLSDEGALEPQLAGPSVVPVVFADGVRIDAAGVKRGVALEDGDLPIPSVTWEHPRVRLRVRAIAPDDDAVLASYRVENASDREEKIELWLTVRPFQVLPEWQFLNTPGGFAPIRAIDFTAGAVRIEGAPFLWPLAKPSAFGAADEGAAGGQTGALPEAPSAARADGFAAGALVFRFVLAPGAAREVHVRAALRRGVLPLATPADGGDALVAAALHAERARWRELVGRAEVELPGAPDVAATLRTALAHLLVNRDGAKLQPGSRNYARSWIRDGALSASSLVQLGHADAARAFLAWYAPFQLESLAFPCCVDARGADPTPEHDSTGAFLYAVGEYARHTGDVAFVRSLWPRIVHAVAYLERLRAERLAERYRTVLGGATYGILPESISHEGYAKKPVHSYWDDLFARQGLRDAVFLAELAGDREHAAAWAKLRDAFSADLVASYEATQRLHGIPHLAGCVELGDFDPTATAVGFELGGEPRDFPPRALAATFTRYLGEVAERKRGVMRRDAFAPYEIRIATALVRMGDRDGAWDVLQLNLAGRRPFAWRQWPEIVWTDEARGQWLGDLPHGWIAATYLHAVRTALVHERASDEALVLAAGVPEAWLASGAPVRVARLSTWWGPIDYDLARESDGALRMRVGGGVRVPQGGIVLAPPGVAPRTVRALPAELRLSGTPEGKSFPTP